MGKITNTKTTPRHKKKQSSVEHVAPLHYSGVTAFQFVWESLVTSGLISQRAINKENHYGDVIMWEWWLSNHRRLDCLLNRLFRQIKESIKALCHWPLWGESTDDRWIPLTRKMVPFDDVIMCIVSSTVSNVPRESVCCYYIHWPCARFSSSSPMWTPRLTWATLPCNDYLI